MKVRLSRLILLGVPILALGAVAVALALPRLRPPESTGYRVDAIFDTAKGIIPGQLVKVAGTRVGTVIDVVLTPDFKARIKMSVDPRFGPFRADARCSIQPEGLIAENFVQCEPGTPDSPQLRARGDEAPTVPVANTTVPVNLTDLFNVFRTPVRQRFSVIVATLGIGTAARGGDFNDVLRRANPTLAAVRRAVTTVNRQRAALSDTLARSDRLVGELAQRRARVQDFIVRAERVTELTADHRRPFAEGLRRLPPLLDEVRPLAARVDELTRDGTPVLRNVRASAPDVHRLVTDLEPLAVAGRPALHELRDTVQQGRQTIEVAEPTATLLRRLTARLKPLSDQLTPVLIDLRRQGLSENLVRFSYLGAALTARYDDTAHLGGAHIFLNADCSLYASTPVEGCNGFYNEDSTFDPASPSMSGAKSSSGDADRARRKGRRARKHERDAQGGGREAEGIVTQAVRQVATRDDQAEQLLGFLLR